MAQEYRYPRWIQTAWLNNYFVFNNETGGWKYKNPTKPNNKYKFEFNPIKDYNIQHGDIINFQGGYRNEGKWIWNSEKKKIELLHTEIDDYGSVPPEYKVGIRFKPDHWINVVDHNTIIWLEDELYSKIDLIYYKNNIEGKIKLFGIMYSILIEIDGILLDKLEYVKNILSKMPPLHFEDGVLVLYC
jgi:hypothetical protein